MKLTALGFGPGVAADLSPDGRRLIFATDHEILVADLVDGDFSAPRTVAKGAPHIEQLVLHPDGFMLAAADANGTVSMWRLDGDSARVVREWASGSTRRCWDLCFSPSGRLLAAYYAKGFTTSMPHRSKSVTFRVAIAQWWRRAMAAI